MNIVFISSNYPTHSQPYRGAFVKEIVHALAILGAKCTVISPVSIAQKKSGNLPMKQRIEYTKTGSEIIVRHPRYIPFSNKKFANFKTYKLTQLSYEKSVMKDLKSSAIIPDILYAHFLYPNGGAAVKIAEKYNIPSVVAVGESAEKLKSNLEDGIGISKASDTFKNLSGVISVSPPNTSYSKNTLGIDANKIIELPNGIDFKTFYPREKKQMREKHNLPKDKFLIAFTGHFNERKGPNRLIEAIKDMENVGVILIGEGDMNLSSSKIIFKGKLEHDLVPEYLSAADIFVLPTLAEGSCNSIIEAMACGLPIVSSEEEFNDGILNSDNSKRIDSLNIKQISDSITKLINNQELRENMGKEALKHSENYSLEKRAEKIFSWLTALEHK